MTGLPETFGPLSVLTEMKMEVCLASPALPETFEQLGRIRELDMRGCKALAAMPTPLSQLTALRKECLGIAARLWSTACPESGTW